eukprot:COSAG01_NODE_655_length_14476_cov_6.592265_2_plen_628_part_00
MAKRQGRRARGGRSGDGSSPRAGGRPRALSSAMQQPQPQQGRSVSFAEPQPEPQAPQQPQQQQQQRCVVLHAYDGQGQAGHLDLAAGDGVVITDGSHAEWWQGYREADPTQQVGNFPANRVAPAGGTAGSGARYRVAHTYDPGPGIAGALPLSEGEVVMVTDLSRGEWWQGYRESDVNRQIGNFPRSYVISLPPGDASTSGGGGGGGGHLDHFAPPLGAGDDYDDLGPPSEPPPGPPSTMGPSTAAPPPGSSQHTPHASLRGVGMAELAARRWHGATAGQLLGPPPPGQGLAPPPTAALSPPPGRQHAPPLRAVGMAAMAIQGWPLGGDARSPPQGAPPQGAPPPGPPPGPLGPPGNSTARTHVSFRGAGMAALATQRPHGDTTAVYADDDDLGPPADPTPSPPPPPPSSGQHASFRGVGLGTVAAQAFGRGGGSAAAAAAGAAAGSGAAETVPAVQPGEEGRPPPAAAAAAAQTARARWGAATTTIRTLKYWSPSVTGSSDGAGFSVPDPTPRVPSTPPPSLRSEVTPPGATSQPQRRLGFRGAGLAVVAATGGAQASGTAKVSSTVQVAGSSPQEAAMVAKPGSASREAFEDAFRQSIAKALGCDPSDVVVDDISCSKGLQNVFR